MIDSIVWLLSFIKDKVLLITYFFKKSNEFASFKARKEYCENFLNDFNHQGKTKEIWHKLFGEQLPIEERKIYKIYRLNSSYFLKNPFTKITYYIKNQFWSSLDLYELDTFNWENKDVFGIPSLMTYLIINKDRSSLLILSTLQDQKYTLLKTYHPEMPFPIWRFKNRQLSYSHEMGFLTI